MAQDPNAVFEFQIIVKVPASIPPDISPEDEDAAFDAAYSRVSSALIAANLDFDLEDGDWYELDV